MVVEGGWPSATAGAVTSDPLKQARYLERQRELLDGAKAIGVFQITFTDIDTTGYNLPPNSILPLFTRLGLVDVNLVTKPALATYDSTFARPLTP